MVRNKMALLVILTTAGLSLLLTVVLECSPRFSEAPFVANTSYPTPGRQQRVYARLAHQASFPQVPSKPASLVNNGDPVISSSTPIKSWIVNQARRMNHFDHSTHAETERLRAIAAQLSESQSIGLKDLVKDHRNSLNERQLGMYLLVQYPEKYHDLLLDIIDRGLSQKALAPLDAHGGNIHASFERALNLQALIALEALAVENPQIANSLVSIAKRYPAPFREQILMSVRAARYGHLYWTTKMKRLTATTNS